MNRFDGLVVIDPYGPDLGIEICQAQVIVMRILVGLNDLERSAKDAAEDELGLAPLPGFEHHVLELDLLPFVQTERVAVNLPALRTGFIFGSCHISKFKVMRLGSGTTFQDLVCVAQNAVCRTKTYLAICFSK